MTPEKLMEFLAESKDLVIAYGLDLLGAVLLLIVGRIVAGWARRGMLRLMNRSTVFDDTLKPLFGNIVYYIVMVFVLIAVLAQFGVQTASIIAVLGAAGLAVGLALQGTLANIAAGVMILTLRPLKVGETVDADGLVATVDEIGLFITRLKTPDGIFVSVPNSSLWNRTIKNFTRLPTRRVNLPIGISYSDDIDKAMDVMKRLIETDKRVLADPAPQVIVTSLGDSSVVLNMRFWSKREDYWDMLWDMTKQVKLALDDAGISIPFPQRDIHIIGETPKLK